MWQPWARFTYLQPLDPSLKEDEEGRVGVNHRLSLQNSLGLQQPLVCVGAIQSKERQHYCVVPQEGQPEQHNSRFTSVCIKRMNSKYAAPHVTERSDAAQYICMLSSTQVLRQ